MKVQKKLSVTMALFLLLNTIFNTFLGFGNIVYAKDNDISSKVVTQLMVNPKEILEGEKTSVNISFEGNKGIEKDIQSGDEINIQWQKSKDSILFATPEILDVFQDGIKIAELNVRKDGGTIKFNEKVDNMENIQSSVTFDLSTEKIVDQNEIVTEEVSSGDKTELIAVKKNSDKKDLLLNNAETKLEPKDFKTVALNENNIFEAQDGGNIDNDVNRNGLLGVAKYFHIFANNATLSVDTTGNVAVGNLRANSNFGTKLKEGLLPLDISYIQNASFIQSSSFVNSNGNRRNKAIFGESVNLTLVDNGNKVAANGSKLDNLNKNEIFQDKNGNKYIDFEKEFTQLKNSSDEIAAHKQTTGVEKNFNDENNRYFDVSKVKTTISGTVSLAKTDEKGNLLDGVVFDLYKVGDNTPIKRELKTENGKITVTHLEKGDYYFKETKTISGYTLNTDEHKFSIKDENLGSKDTIYLDLTKEELEKDRPIIIKGIDKNGPNIIVNVDTENAQTINIGAEIKLQYIDGTDRPNHETEDFSDAVILWNFKNRASGQIININRASFQGSILAVGDIINVGQNVDGCIIANDVNINGGESHRWDFQEKFGYEGKPVELSVINKKIPESEEPIKPDEEYVKINVEKKWEGKIPENKEVVIELYADDKKIEGKSVTLNKDNSWKSSFENLPKYKNNKEIKYEIKEVKIDGYSPKIENNKNSTSTDYWVMIKSPENLESGRKYLIAIENWTNKNNYYLLSDNGEDEILGLKNFDGLKAFKSTDNGGLEKELNLGNRTYNEYFDFNETNYTEDNKELFWLYSNINNNEALKNPESGNYITLKGENKNPIKYSFITSKKDGWHQQENYNWGVNYSRNLKFENGAAEVMSKINSIQEWGNPPKPHVAQYINLPNGSYVGATENSNHAGNFKFFKKITETTYSYIVTNTEILPLTPMEPPKRDIKVVKNWELLENEKQVEKIEVELYKDGVATGKKLELTKDNNWSGEFKKLEVADKLGSTNYYNYTVKEVGENAGSIKFGDKWFKVSYEGNMKDGFKITNKELPPYTPMIPPTPEKPNNPTPPEPEKPVVSKEGKPTIPKTGEGTNLSVYAWAILLSGIALILIGYKRTKHAK